MRHLIAAAVSLLMCPGLAAAQPPRCLPNSETPCFLRAYMAALETGHRLMPGYVDMAHASRAAGDQSVAAVIRTMEGGMRRRAAAMDSVAALMRPYAQGGARQERVIASLFINGARAVRHADSLMLSNMRETAKGSAVPSTHEVRQRRAEAELGSFNEAVLSTPDTLMARYGEKDPAADQVRCLYLSPSDREAWAADLRRHFGSALDDLRHEVPFAGAAIVLHARLATWEGPMCTGVGR